MPRVSVILNCYNHEPYVAEAVESVLAQTFTDFELLLIDNGSTDGSRAILDGFTDPRIRRFFHDHNESLSKRLNEGVAQASGEFVAVLYSDDLMLPDKLARQIALFDHLPADYGVVYCPAIGFNQFTGARWTYPSFALEGDIADAMFDRFFDGPVDMSSPLTRASCFREHHWHEDLFGDGEAVFLRIAGTWKFHFDPAPTVMLRDHDSNLGKAIRMNHDMHMAVLDRLLGAARMPAARRRSITAHRARACVHHAWTYARRGGTDSRWVKRQLKTAMASAPAALPLSRFAATLLLAAIPPSLRDRINRFGNRFADRRRNRALVESL